MNDDTSKGKPGKPGKDASGQVGGQGGQGGQGGEGRDLGGPGGVGGAGGAAIGKSRGDLQRALWAVAFATAALFLFLVALGTYAYVANTHRINDIQNSRLHSCQQTYEAFHKVFDPLIPPVKDQSEKEQADIAAFNKEIKKLINSCARQTNAERG
jgi:hypothetical protein